ncbi:MAG: hypothetical protein AYK22_01760 [Thermoplasmatales archaeon SG8-52-3]|nr:MAG: hypothetical protein AYK22_01760 [Thermoplasmatales archaeon SG8-52-3]
MNKKILIAGLIICAYLIAATSTVMAADETKVFYDGSGDVIDETGGTNPDITDIDFDEITYQKEDDQVTLELEFVGNIKKSSGLLLTLELETSENLYTYAYFNVGGLEEEYGIVTTEEGDEDLDITITGFDTKKLTFKFNLISDDEDYVSMAIYTAKVNEQMEDPYYDIYPNILTIQVTIDGPSEGKVDEAIQFFGEANGGKEPYEWEWHFDEDLEIDSSEQNPEFTFDAPGEYEVQLFVTDNEGNIGFNTSTIKINGGSTNGDGNSGEESPLLLFVGLIVIIVIVGIAVVVYVVRR